MLRALIFVFDGTILDSETPEFTAWQHIYREHAVELAKHEWLRGVGTIGGFDPLAHLHTLTDGRVQPDVKRRAQAHNVKQIHENPILDGVLALFDQAEARGAKLAVASSASRDWVEGHLRRLGLYERMAVVRCRDDHGGIKPKPAPDLYLSALAGLGVPAHEAMAFEDSLNGMRGALAAGLFTVVCPNEITAALDFRDASLTVRSLAEVTFDHLAGLLPR